VAYIGLRDLDDGERVCLKALQAQGLFVATMQHVDAHGIGQVRARRQATARSKPQPRHPRRSFLGGVGRRQQLRRLLPAT
jgi:arginase family enzyme